MSDFDILNTVCKNNENLNNNNTLQIHRPLAAGVIDENNVNDVIIIGSSFENSKNKINMTSQQVLVVEDAAAGHDGIAHKQLMADNPEVNITSENFQRQLIQNQQLIIQQQKTVNQLVQKVDTLAKLVENRYEDVSESENELDQNSDSESVNTAISNQCGSSRQTVPSTERSPVTESQRMLLELGENFEKKETYGEKLNQNLADVVNSGIKSSIDRKLALSLVQGQERPQNCEFLSIPILNKELYTSSMLQKTTREADKKFQTTQGYLTAGMIPLVSLMNSLVEDNKYELFGKAKDAFQLLAYAHRDMTNLRRQHLRPGLQDKYQQLCNDATPLSQNLLGDDLERQIKSLDDMRKISRDIVKLKMISSSSHTKGQKRDHHGHRINTGNSYRSYTQPQVQHSPANPFLGKQYRPQQPVHKQQRKGPAQQKRHHL